MARSALGAVAAATVIGFAEVPEGIPAALSALVAAINVAHPRGDHWRSCRRAAEALRRERELLLGHFGSYAARANATALCIQPCALALWQVEPGPLPIGRAMARPRPAVAAQGSRRSRARDRSA